MLPGWAGVPVTEDGPLLSLATDVRNLTVRIQSDQSLAQQHLEKLRALEEGSKAVALAMAQMNSLLKHGELLGSDPTSGGSSATGLQYDGKSFSGGNYGFIDNLMGEHGPIALDRMVPATLIPVSGPLLQQAQQSVASFSASAPSSLLDSTSAALAGSFASPPGSGSDGSAVPTLVGQFLQANGSGDRPISGMLGNGVFLRSYAGAVDDAFLALVQNGSAAQRTQFFADSSLGGQGYHAILGLTGNPDLTMVNMDNVLSAGALEAVHAFLQANSSPGSNPYQGYANQLMDQIPALLAQTAPGQPLTPGTIPSGSSGSSNASGAPRQFPSLFSETAPPAVTLASYSPFGVPGPDDQSSRGVVVITPPAAEALRYQSRIAESDQRLRQVWQELQVQQQAAAYDQKVLESLRSIEGEARGLETSINHQATQAIPELTILLREVQDDVERHLQSQNSFSLQMQNLQGELHTELTRRAAVVDAEQRTQAAQALPRWRASMAGSSID